MESISFNAPETNPIGQFKQPSPWPRVFSVTYREFSRHQYQKIKHQTPRMRESEIISKILKKWDALSTEQKVKLAYDFCKYGKLCYPGLKAALDYYYLTEKVTPHFSRLIFEIDFKDEKEEIEIETEKTKNYVQKPGPGVEIPLPKSLTKDYIEEEEVIDSDFEREKNREHIFLESESSEEPIKEKPKLPEKKHLKPKKTIANELKIEELREQVNLINNKQKINDLIEQLQEIDNKIEVYYKNEPIEKIKEIQQPFYEQLIDKNVIETLEKYPELLHPKYSEELKNAVQNGSKENIMSKYVKLLKEKKSHWTPLQQFTFAQLLTEKKLIEDQKRIYELVENARKERNRDKNYKKYKSRITKKTKTLCGKKIQEKNLEKHQRKCEECFMVTKENSNEPEPQIACLRSHIKTFEDKLSTVCGCGAPLVAKEKKLDFSNKVQKGWTTRKIRKKELNHRLLMARNVKKDRKLINEKYSQNTDKQ